VDPTESLPPWRMTGHREDQPGSSAGRPEGSRQPDGSDNPLYAMLRNSGALHPGERPVYAVHKHQAVLIGFISMTLVTLSLAGWLTTSVKNFGKNGTPFSITLFHHVEKVTGQRGDFILSIWVLWGLVVLYLVYKIMAWTVSYFVITDRQLIFIAGTLARRVASVPISHVTSWYVRESLAGRFMGYRSLVFKQGNGGGVVRTIGYIPVIEIEYIKEVLPSYARTAGDEEAFQKWAVGGLRRRVRLIIAALLICLLVALALAAATVPRIRTELSNEAEIIALIPILIVLITPKN
jgi:uncharacterized membrane protein YdbT with pleckstrin-like domain